MKANICLITPGQPSTNPRLVKEADALSEAGYEVQVICAHWAAWASEADKALLASRNWSCIYVGGDPIESPLRYRWSRLRHGLTRRIVTKGYASRLLGEVASSRVLPELMRAARAIRADLYIAHNLAALPPAVAAARKYGAKVGFDAEDFHSGMDEGKQITAIIERIEKQYLPQCHYLTAGSPEIGDAYATKYEISVPIPILNVFPLSERPLEFRKSAPLSPLKLYWFSQTIGNKRGLEDVVQALGLLPECNIELHLRGSWQAGYKEELLQLALTVGVDASKIIDHTPRPSDEMVCLSANYDVGLALEHSVNRNRDICLTNKIFTYLLGGNAIIATATTAQKTMMETIGKAGFCYEPGDIDTLAAQLKFWHDDRQSLEKAREQSWDWGTRPYNWNLEKQKFLDIVEKTLKSLAK